MSNPVSGQDEPNLALIGYLSRQDGAIQPACNKGFVPQGKFTMFWCFIIYNKSFIDQACSVTIRLGPCGKQLENLRLIACLTTCFEFSKFWKNHYWSGCYLLLIFYFTLSLHLTSGPQSAYYTDWHVNMVLMFQICPYFRELFYKSSRALLHVYIALSKHSVRILIHYESQDLLLKFSQPSLCLVKVFYSLIIFVP